MCVFSLGYTKLYSILHYLLYCTLLYLVYTHLCQKFVCDLKRHLTTISNYFYRNNQLEFMIFIKKVYMCSGKDYNSSDNKREILYITYQMKSISLACIFKHLFAIPVLNTFINFFEYAFQLISLVI